MIGHYQGAATDLLWQRIAAQTKCMPALVANVFFALLEHSHAHGPDIAAWSVHEYAHWASVEPADIERILVAMRMAGVVVDNQLAVLHGGAGHDRTQAARARRYRQRKASAAQAASRKSVTHGGDAVTEKRDATMQASRKTVTVPPQSVTGNRDASEPASRKTVTKQPETVTVSRSGKGGGLGGGMGFSCSSLLNTLSSAESTSDAPAREKRMFEALKSAGAIITARQEAQALDHVQAWVKQGITEETLASAIRLAKASRIAAGSDQPLNAAYIAAKFDSASRSAPAAAVAEHVASTQHGDPSPGSRVAAERASILGHYARLVDFGRLTPEAANERAAAELAALDARTGAAA